MMSKYFMLQYLIFLLINIIIGFVASNMAAKRGLLKIPAYFVGFFGSFLALLIIAMFPKRME